MCNVLIFFSSAKFVIIQLVALRSIIHVWPESLKRKQSQSVRPAVNFGLMKSPVSIIFLFGVIYDIKTETGVTFINR